MEYLVIDTESCTGRDNDGSLCSLGYAICDENLNVLEQKDLLFNPLPKRFSVGDEKHYQKTGIAFAYTVDEFRKAPRFSELYDKIVDLFKDRIVLGFAMGNDVKYLNNACDKFNLPRIEYKFYDIQFVYQLLHPDEKSVGLKTLNAKYQIDYVAHRSDEDAVGSVLLLKKFLESDGYTFEKVIKKYKIHKGKNTKKGYHVCYSGAMIEELYGLKVSKRIQSFVLSDHIKNLVKPKGNANRFCFSFKIEKMDVNFVRTLIDLALQKGLYFDHDTDIVNVYVSDEGIDKRVSHLNQKKNDSLKIYTLEEFCKYINYTENLRYDDKKFLTKFYTQLII